MYRTSEGDRTLEGAEATMFAAALGQAVFWLRELPDDGWGIEAFDRLTLGQKLTALCTVGEALLKTDVAPPALTQSIDATVATVYKVLEAEVIPEIDEFDVPEQPAPRFAPLVVAHAEEAGYTCPDYDRNQIHEWELLIDVMSERILFDMDYEDEDIYADLDPAVAEAAKERMTIADDYFRDVVDDPTDDAIEPLFKRLKALTAHAWPG